MSARSTPAAHAGSDAAPPGGNNTGRRRQADPPDRLLDVYEAAALLGLKSPRTLYKWAYAGRIPSVKIGRLLRFRRSDLERLITAGKRPAFASPDRFPLTATAAAR